MQRNHWPGQEKFSVALESDSSNNLKKTYPLFAKQE
jgi:hypothetical protein